jgi:hypothetical protein
MKPITAPATLPLRSALGDEPGATIIPGMVPGCPRAVAVTCSRLCGAGAIFSRVPNGGPLR